MLFRPERFVKCSQAGKETSTCGSGELRSAISGVFQNVRGALSFSVEPQDVVIAAAVALGVLEFDKPWTEIDGQHFIVLSALTDGGNFDVMTSAGGDRGFESWLKLHKRWDPHTAGRARSLVREDPVNTAREVT